MASLVSPKDLVEGDIFELMGIEHISEEKKQIIMQGFIEAVQANVLVRVDDLLQTDHDHSELRRLLENGTDEETSQFLVQKNINIADLVLEESLLQKNKLIQMAQTVKEG